MRPIDGDKLLRALMRKEPFNDCARIVIAECIEEVRHAPTIETEIIVCADCKYWTCFVRRCEYWNHVVKPLDWCSHAERRTDE